VPSAKLLITRWLIVRNQQVAGSIPAGGSMFSITYVWAFSRSMRDVGMVLSLGFCQSLCRFRYFRLADLQFSGEGRLLGTAPRN
jgi:hypothetical protein